MHRNIKKMVVFTTIILLTLCCLNLTKVYAASTTLKATPSASKVKSGATFSVTVSSSVKLTGWTIALTNKGECTFSTASGGELTGTTIYGADLSGKTSLATYTFKAPTVTKDTKCTISFSGSEMCDVDTNELTGTNCSTTITVEADKTTNNDSNSSGSGSNTNLNSSSSSSSSNSNTSATEKPKEKSDNANLKTLGVRITDSLASELGVKTDEYDFSGFSKSKTSYNVTVPKNVKSLKVIATPADSKASVKISGNSGFEVGSNNKITIKVTAEAGNTKTYTIKVTQLAEEEEKPGNLIEDQEGLYLTSLSIKGVELTNKFDKDIYSYTATLNDSKETELTVNAVANNEKANIEISGNTNLVEGENTINVLLTLEGSELQTVYQIVVTKEIEEDEIIATNVEKNETSSTTDIIGMFKGYIGIAIGAVLLMIIIVIILIILLRKENKRLREEDEDDDADEEIESDEYNVYNSDNNEFASEGLQKDNFIESLYKQRNRDLDEEDLTQTERETLEEISKQTEEIFTEKVQGQSVEYSSNEQYEQNPLEVRKRRRGKGKHSL